MNNKAVSIEQILRLKRHRKTAMSSLVCVSVDDSVRLLALEISFTQSKKDLLQT